jgi:hypothetical protein
VRRSQGVAPGALSVYIFQLFLFLSSEPIIVPLVGLDGAMMRRKRHRAMGLGYCSPPPHRNDELPCEALAKAVQGCSQ